MVVSWLSDLKRTSAATLFLDVRVVEPKTPVHQGLLPGEGHPLQVEQGLRVDHHPNRGPVRGRVVEDEILCAGLPVVKLDDVAEALTAAPFYPKSKASARSFSFLKLAGDGVDRLRCNHDARHALCSITLTG